MNWGKPLIVCAVAMSAPASAEQWWWIGLNGNAPQRVVTYVDKDSVRGISSGAVEVWTLAVGETPLTSGQQHQAARYAIRCNGNSFATTGLIAYDAQGSKMPLVATPPAGFGPAVPGSIGESVVRLVCGRPAGNERLVSNPIRHAVSYLAEGGVTPTPKSDAKPRMSIGTGFFVGPKGDILTSYHVIEGARRIGCRTPDGHFHDATVSRVSRLNDLAVVRVKARPKSYLSLAPAGSLESGDRVFTVGYGAANFLGVSEPRFTDGVVSALSGVDAEDAYMQISVPVQPGNSGGPLVNEAGQVVGVIAAQAAVQAFLKAEGTLPQNVNWAVKSDYASPLVNSSASPKRSRQQAIEVAKESLCLIVAEN